MADQRPGERIKVNLSDLQRDWRLFRLNRQITNNAHPKPENPTVAFFAVSTRLTGISLNAAFAYLTACGLQVAGSPVVYFSCQAGMSRCVLGTKNDDPYQPPPCDSCISQSQRLFAHAPSICFTYQEDEKLKHALEDLNLDELSRFEYPAARYLNSPIDIPLGKLVLPSLRWARRMHNLMDDEPTRFLFREYIQSAWRVANEFVVFLDQAEPQVLVVFNGVLYPEATARWVAQQRGLRVITHEVGFQPFSAFFTEQEATAYLFEIPAEVNLTSEQNRSLDDYLDQRLQGEFTMAGIRFWPEIRELDEQFNAKADQYDQIVPIFTNVIFDTSQIHANKIFSDMFAWLELADELIRSHPKTLFVIRAHPDEWRSGKKSQESVPDWIKKKKLDQRNNVVFVHPDEHLSSYELIQRAKFVMVYNSSIGLEASLLGKAVLCGGKARYTPFNTVYFPDSPQEYRKQAEKFLDGKGEINVPKEFLNNSRRYMYYQLFKASLPFDEFIEGHIKPGFVRLKSFNWRHLKPENSATMKVLVDGIIHGKPFLLDD